jgi:hypothetical protein
VRALSDLQLASGALSVFRCFRSGAYDVPGCLVEMPGYLVEMPGYLVEMPGCLVRNDLDITPALLPPRIPK